MRSQSWWARSAVGSVLVVVCAAACADVLDIQDPKTRNNNDGGAGGEVAEPTGAGTATGGGGTGNNPVRVPGAGQGGEEAPGGAGTGAVGGAGAAGGEGGEGGMPSRDCEPEAMRCGGDTAKAPEICDETGHWIANSDEADSSETDGDCAVACLAGKCVECVDSDPPQCKACADGADDCNSNQRQKCVGGAWTDDGDPCEQFCMKGSCETAPSCGPDYKVRTTCHVDESCCESLSVPGGTFNRYIEDDIDTPYRTTVSPFYLDKFEVTVGRMRQFVSTYEQLKPTFKDGDGRSTHIPDDTGWSTSFTLPTDKLALLGELKCSDSTWSDSVGVHDDLPVNCVTFSVAYAFCIWDGGRLPTEAEWEFAAAGGEAQRAYPWKMPDSGPPVTPEYANYSSEAPVAAGATPLGNGRWGQSDLAGNVAEWVLDYGGQGYPETCQDCLTADPQSARVFRGGSYSWDQASALTSVRDLLDATLSRSYMGFRCARDLE